MTATHAASFISANRSRQGARRILLGRGLRLVPWTCAALLGLIAQVHAQSAEPAQRKSEPPNAESPASEPSEASSFGATATAEAPVAATNREDATAAGSTIDARERGRALEDVAEALVEAPGLQVRNTGGAGSFSGVALRGAELGHTAVLLGAIPLNGPDSGAFDLSVVPLSALNRIEVYCGGAPAWYSEGAIGGVVRFVPASDEGNWVQASGGYGSFGRAEVQASSSASRQTGARPAFFGNVRVLRADNDYPYTDDGQTAFDPSDDRELRQRNADILATDSLLHTQVDGLGGRVSFLFAGHGRLEGVPGPLAAPALNVRRKLVRVIGGAAYELEEFDADAERKYRLQFVASGSHQLNALTDLQGELGTSRSVDTDDVWRRAHLRAAGGLRVASFLEPSLILGYARDAFRPEDALAFSAPPRPSDRHNLAATGELRFFGRLGKVRAELRPSVRAAWYQSHIRANSGLSSVDEQRDEFAPTYRLAALLEPVRALSVSASVANGVRVPSISELFGDRAFQQPNPSLKPERSTSTDLSLVLRGRAGSLRGSVEARGFALWIDELIRFERTSQFTVRPENISRARILGGEFGVLGDLGRHLSLTSSLTAMQTRNQFDKELPLRPRLQALVRPQLQFFPHWAERVGGFFELHHVSSIPLDDGNIAAPLPARTLLATGLAIALLQERVQLEARVNDLLDQRPTDVLSRPLPGRDFRISLTLREDSFAR